MSARRHVWRGAIAPSSTACSSGTPWNPAYSRSLECPVAQIGDSNGAGQGEAAQHVEPGDDSVAVGEEAHDERRAEVRHAPPQPAQRQRRAALFGLARLGDGDLEI